MLLENTKLNGRNLNIAGKQRVLSQRSLFLLKKITESKDKSNKNLHIQILKNELYTFKKHHNQIIQIKAGNLLETSLKISTSDQRNINTYIFKIENYLKQLESGIEEDIQREFNKFADFVFISLFSSLDTIVSKLQNKDEKKYLFLVNVLFFLTFTRFLLLTFELKFVYRPLNKNLKIKNEKLKVASNRLLNESKLLRSAKHLVIKNNNVDISNALNRKLRTLTNSFFKQLKEDLFFNQLDKKTHKKFKNLLSLHNEFSKLISIRGDIDHSKIDLNKVLSIHFKTEEIDVKFLHNATIKGNPFLMEIFFNELSSIIKSPNFKYSKVLVEHINDQFCLSIKQLNHKSFDLSSQKMKKLEFLIQKNGAQVHVKGDTIQFNFEVVHLTVSSDFKQMSYN